MAKDFGDMIEEQVEAQHRWIIDEAPRVRISDGPITRVVARLEVGEARIVEYWDPETYTLIDTPACIHEEEL